MKRTLAAAAVAVCASAALSPATAVAQSGDAWQFGASIYLYGPTVGGKSKFPESGGGSDVAIDSSKVVDSIQGVFMGSFEARKGPWGGFTDLIYIDLGQSRSNFRQITIGGNQIPADASTNVDYNLTGTSWTLAGTYRVVPDARRPTDLFLGARMLDIKQKLGWQFSGNVGSIALADRAGTRSMKLQNWDAIVGVKGRWGFGSGGKWFVPYYLDVGTGESELTYQIEGGIGYAFRWGDVVGSWRYLDYKMKSGHNTEKLNFSGPSIAAVFHW